MKILFPIGSFYPAQSGGPNNTIYWHTKALKKNRIEPVIVTTNKDLTESHNIKLDKWLSLGFGDIKYVKKRMSLFPLGLIRNTISMIPKVDVIHLTSIFYPPSFIIAIVNELFFRKKVVWSIRGELDISALRYSKNKKQIMLFILKKIRKSNIYFHATCKAEVKYIKDVFGQKAKTVLFSNSISLPNKVKIKNKEKYLLFIGRIHPIKALENLIKALHKSTYFKISSFKFKIAGNHDNSYGESLKKLVIDLKLSNKIEFIGHIAGEEKQRLYANAYFTLMPSHTENFGNVVVESLAQNTPVLASKGTPWEILTEYEAGYWSENSVNELAHTLDDLMCLSEERYIKMRENAYRLVTDKFDVEKNILKWIDFYKQMLNE